MFKVYHSNDLGILAELGLMISRAKPLIDENGEIDLFKKECILVQSEGMKTFIYQAWAKGTGIAVQLEHNFIWSYVWNLGRSIIDGFPSINPYDRQTLTLNLVAIFSNESFLKKIRNDSTFEPILKFLDLDSNKTTTKDKSELDFFANIDINGEDRVYQLAASLADLYDQYQVYRMNWIDTWDSKENLTEEQRYKQWITELKHGSNDKNVLNPDDYKWQAKLWHEYVRSNYCDIPLNDENSDMQNNNLEYSRSYSEFDRTTALKRIIEKLNNSTVGELKSQLPQRIFVYGVTSIPPVIIDIFMALGKHIDVHFMFNNPCSKYWGDLNDAKKDLINLKKRVVKIVESSKIKNWDGESGESYTPFSDLLENNNIFDENGEIQVGNSLLLSYGKQGRDTLALLVEKTASVGNEQVGDIQAFVDPISADNSSPKLLDILKHDIYSALDISTLGEEKRIIHNDDTSLIFHSCSSRLREIQVAYDNIMELFVKDPTLKPRDIIVMTPNIGAYAPFIDGVFKTNNTYLTPLPYAICDRSLNDENPIMDSIMTLFGLNDGILSSIDVFELFKTEQIRQHFGINIEDLDIIEDWINENNIIRGLDQKEIIKASASLDLKEGDYPLTFSDGLRRLLLGSLMPEIDSDDFVTYNTNIEGAEVKILGHFYNFILELINLRDTLDQDRSIDDWMKFIQDELYAKFFDFGDKDFEVSRSIANALNKLNSSIKTLNVKPKITLGVLRRTLEGIALSSAGFSRFLRDTLNFCTFVPMRSIPFKHVFLLGMNDGEFPRNKDYLNFDLMSQYFEKGDRSSRNDDRYMFLEAILSAEQSLYISYIGRSQSKGNELNPSILVSELMDYIWESCKLDNSCSDKLKDLLFKQERFNAYDDENFFGDKASFQTQWLEQKYLTTNTPAHELTLVKSSSGNDSRVLCTEKEYIVSSAQGKKQLDKKPVFAQGLFMLGKLEEDITNTVDISLDELVYFYTKPAEYFIKKVLGIYTNNKDDLIINESFDLNSLTSLKIQNSLWGKEEKDAKLYLDTLSQKGELPLRMIGEMSKKSIFKKYDEIADFNKFLIDGNFKSENIDITIKLLENDELCPIVKCMRNLIIEENGEKTNISLYKEPINVHIYGTVGGIYCRNKNAVPRLVVADSFHKEYRLLMPNLIKILALEVQNKGVGYALTAIDKDNKVEELNETADESIENLALLVKIFLLARVKPLPIFGSEIYKYASKKNAKFNLTNVSEQLCQHEIINDNVGSYFDANELAIFSKNIDYLKPSANQYSQEVMAAAMVAKCFMDRLTLDNKDKTPNEILEII